MNGSMDVVIDRIPNAVIVPAQAVFTRGRQAGRLRRQQRILQAG